MLEVDVGVEQDLFIKAKRGVSVGGSRSCKPVSGSDRGGATPHSASRAVIFRCEMGTYPGRVPDLGHDELYVCVGWELRTRHDRAGQGKLRSKGSREQSTPDLQQA